MLCIAANPNDAPLDIEAAKLEVRQEQGEARFSGGVVVRQGLFTLRCSTILARYDKTGRLDMLEAEGEVRVEAEAWSAVAGRARYDRKAETLTLFGSPTLTRAKDVLRGERIVFWVAEKRMVVEKVRGRVKAPRLSDIGPGGP